MNKYIDADKLIAEIERQKKSIDECPFIEAEFGAEMRREGKTQTYNELLSLIASLQQEQPDNMIQWTGNNLKEVIGFTGKSPKFGEWFKSWEEYENYVHTHNDILKLFCEDGSHYEVPVGAWIVKTPDGYNVPSVAKYVQQEQSEVDLEKEYEEFVTSDPVYSKLVNGIVGKAIARHFFELARQKYEK